MQEKAKFFWGYSIILFTIAFVLIFMSAVSQQRLSKDVKTYKAQLNKQQWLYQGVQDNISDLTEENRNLKEKTRKQEEQIEEYEEKLNSLLTQMDRLTTQNEDLIRSFDNLIAAEKSYKNKDTKKSAMYLSQVNYDILNENGQEIYNSFAKTVFDKAANQHYTIGYKNYKEGKYGQAIEELNKSLEYNNKMFFSDDALFFLIKSLIETEEDEKTKEGLLKFKEDYPSSPYITEVNRLLRNIEEKGKKE